MDSNNISTKNNQEKNQNESKHLLKNIKNNVILKKICQHCKKHKCLDLIKNNKILQNRLEFKIDDYKEYSEKLSQIELEIIPVENPIGTFINIWSRKDEPYYHIFFNNSQKELKRYHLNEKDKVIKIIIDHQVKSFYGLFQNRSTIKSIVFKKFYRKDIFDMSYMFYNCDSIKKLEFHNCKTINLSDMTKMFYNCTLLEAIDLSNFNTIKIKDMSNLFYECSSLQN